MKQLKITKFPALDYAGNEAFNTLSTNLSFAGASVKKIMITSCHAAEGKSYLSMNLMRTLAQRGIKVALVDADLRRSMVNSDYGLKYEDGRSDGKGLSHFLAGMVGMDEVIYQTDIPNAIMVPVGRDVPNPLALLTNSHFAELLDMLARMADYVIVDAPPVGVVIDAAEIAKACDGTLIAVNYNDVSRQELLDVKQQIEQTGCPILGTVLNQVDYDNYMGRKYYKSYSKYGKYGYYVKYYTRSHEAEKKRAALRFIMRTSSTAWTMVRRPEKKCMPCWMQRQQTVCGTCLLPRTVRRAWNTSRRKSMTGIWRWPAHTAHKKATT